MTAETDGLARAQLLLSTGRYQDASALAYQCAASKPGDPRPLIIAAWAEIGLRRFDAGEQAARAAIAVAPTLAEAHRALVAVLTNRAYSAGRYATGQAGRRAVAAAKRLVRLAPTEVSSHWALIDSCVAASRVRSAVAASNTALAMAPESTHTWFLRGRAARLAGDLQVAESAIREALRLEPDSYEANNELGIIMRGRGRTAQALQQLTSTASMNPIARPARANLVRYGAAPFQVIILLLTLPILLVVHPIIVWILVSIAINTALWRFEPTKRRLERRALAIAIWRSRRPARRSQRKEALVPPHTPIQSYRNNRTVLVLSLLFLIWMSALATGAAAQLAPDFLPLCLFIDVPTCAFAWFVYKRFRPRPAVEP